MLVLGSVLKDLMNKEIQGKNVNIFLPSILAYVLGAQKKSY